MVRGADMSLMAHVIAIATKWARRPKIVKNDIAVGEGKVLSATIAWPATANKAAATDDQTARRAPTDRHRRMDLAVNTVLSRTVHRSHPLPMPISQIRSARPQQSRERKKLTASP